MITRRKPIARSTKPLKRSAVRRRRPGAPRRGPAGIPAEEWRNPAYLQFLRDEGVCLVCQGIRRHDPDMLTPDGVMARLRVRACEPMHGPPNGKSQKGPDAGAIPGCRSHHVEQTRIGWPAFQQKYHFDRERESQAWWYAFTIVKEHESYGYEMPFTVELCDIR